MHDLPASRSVGINAERTGQKMTLNKRANATLVTKLFAAGVTYGFTILLARTMRAEDFGQVAFFLNFALLMSVFGACGQQMALLRFLPSRGKNQHGAELRALLANSLRLTAVGTVLTFVFLAGVALMGRQIGLFMAYSSATILFGLALILVVGWADYQVHFLRGYNYVQAAIFPKEVLWRLIAGLLILVFSFAAHPTVVPVLIVLLATLVVLNIAQIRWVRSRVATPGLSLRKNVPSDAEWRKSIAPFWITSVSNIFLANADVICVGLFLGAEPAAYYFAANRLAMLLAFFLTSHNVVLAPMLSQAWAWGQREQVAELVQGTTRRTTLQTAISGAVAFFAAPYALSIFGPDFAQADLVLRILVVAAVLNAAAGPADIVLNMCGFERQAMHASALALFASAALLVVGALTAGPTGVALAVLAATGFRKFLVCRQTVRLMSLRTDILATWTPALRGSREAAYQWR